MANLEVAIAAGASQRAACACVGISVRTLQRWRRSPEAQDARRGPTKVPQHRLTEAERDAIVEVATSAEFRNSTPEQIVAALATRGTYICSERSLRRILKERGLARRRTRTRAETSRPKPRERAVTGPRQVLSWDITYLPLAHVRGAYVYLYMFIDVFSRAVVGAEVHVEQSAELAASLLRHVSKEHQLEAACVVHADNGSPMKGSTMLATMHSLGIVPSFSRPRVSDDNPYIEALFRHMKYLPRYPRKGFQSLEHARAWVQRFVHWYNEHHLHSGIGYVTPLERHNGEDITILAQRRATYEAARARHPRRWTRQPRAWHRIDSLVFHPDRTITCTSNSRAA